MGFRFRKSVKAGPVRLNFSKSGIGSSIGVKGFRFTKKAGGGTRTTTNIPGTGISFVKDSKKQSRRTDELSSQRPPDDTEKKKKVKEPWWAWALIAAVIIGGCFSITDKPEQAAPVETTIETTVTPTEEPVTIATEPSTLPPSRPPEEVLPKIERQLSDVKNSRFYIDGSTLCMDTYEDDVTQTGSVAYDGFEGSDEAWKLVVDLNIARCAMMRSILDNEGAYDTTAKINVLDHRFSSREILTIVDGEVVEDTVAAERAVARSTLPNAVVKSDADIQSTTTSYILNTNTNKFHKPGCSSIKQMNESNKQSFSGTRSDVISMGYEPCKICNP